jgi:glutamate decarboxylase
MRSPADLDALIDATFVRLRELLRGADDRDPRVCEFAGPDLLERTFADAGVPLPFRPGEPAHELPALTRAIDATIAHSVRTLHPRFFNQNFAGADPAAIVGDFLGAALNTTLATYEAAPVFTLMERALLARLAALAGWPTHDGLFVAGGSLANLHALQLARTRVDPDCSERGVTGPRLVAFTSAHAHYSLQKAVTLLGLGRRSLVVVACDERGRMRPDALAQALQAAAERGERPFFVNATAGTTVLGAFDPLVALADLAEQHGLWLHVDGTFGASALFSPTQRSRMAGVERADSLAWNFHKMLGVTQQCSALLVRRPGALRSTFAARAEYLFQPDKPHADLDTGDLGFACARRNDVLKLWLTWKFRGDAGLAARIDHAVALAEACAARLAADPRFALAAPPSWVNLCFWWVPPQLRPLDRQRPGTDATLHALAPRIKARLLADGAAMLAYQPIGDAPNSFRLLVINPAVTPADLDLVLAEIDRHGRALNDAMHEPAQPRDGVASAQSDIPPAAPPAR